MEDSDDGNNSRGPFSYPYSSSYGFAASSWDLRRNLAETFDQHVGTDDHEEKPGVSLVSKKAHEYEKGSLSRPNSKMAAMVKEQAGKPPKQPSNHRSSNNDNGPKRAGTGGEKRCVSVFLRVRPPKTGMVNTIDIVPGDPPVKVRTHAPKNSNAARMSRDSSSSSSRRPSASSSSDTQQQQMVTREFDFHEVFGPDKENADLYSRVVAPMVVNMFPLDDNKKEPESGLLFAYGATNAGKTYSILGKMPSGHGKPVNDKHRGIVPRAIEQVLQHIEHFQTQGARRQQSFDLYMSMLEIHNENIYDLLEQDQDTRHPSYVREPLKLRESQKHTFVRGLVKRPVNSVQEGIQLMKQANSKRHTASNNLNSDSSRSHCIFQLQVIKRSANQPKLRHGSSAAFSNGYNTDEEAAQIMKRKPITLWIVDLAGSERSKRTNVGNLQQKEASLINKSLTTLMRCLSIIRENKTASSSARQMVPFRDSKLTHLFMPVLTGRSASSINMIVNVNPSPSDYDETHHVLSYASKARMIEIEERVPVENSRQASTNEYGYNGRPIKKSSAVSKVKKMIQKLSPKKLMKRGSKDEEKRMAEQQAERKRKVAHGSSRAASSLSIPSPSNSHSSKDHHKAKKPRVNVLKPGASFIGAQPKQHHAAAPTAADNNTIKSLKIALSIAHAEIETLKSENYRLTDELGEAESKIRLEVSAEMDAIQTNTKRYYEGIIDRMKASSRESVGIFEQHQSEQMEEQLDVLRFKVEEAEDEMKRMTQAHREEIDYWEGTAAAQQQEIDQLKARLRGGDEEEAGNPDRDEKDAIVDIQRKKILEQEQELAALKQSKLQLIEAYEKLLQDDGEEDEESESDEEGSDDDEDDDEESTDTDENHNKDQNEQSKYMTNNRFAQKAGMGQKDKRVPLSAISNDAGLQ